MFEWAKKLFYDHQYLFVGKLYKLKQEVGFNCGQPVRFKTVPKNTILLLVSKERLLPHGLTVYTFLYNNEFIVHTNEARYEKYFFRLFETVEENA